MSIDDYLQMTQQTRADLASRVGCAANTMHRIARGEQKPRPALAGRIVKQTKGAVSWVDLFGDVLAGAS